MLVYDCSMITLGWQKENVREGIISITSFNHKRHSHETTLSSYVWHLKETLDESPNLKWSVVRWATPYSYISKKCFLCWYEKLIIITYPRQYKLLNKQSELFCKCRHENRYLLKNFEVSDKG